jgi:molybdopterin synthase catalytic subunit
MAAAALMESQPIEQAFERATAQATQPNVADDGEPTAQQDRPADWAPANLVGPSTSRSHDYVFVQLTNEPLDLNALTHRALDPRCGGVSAFIGTTRDHHGGQRVSRLEYEAYIPMAVKEMRVLGQLACQRFEQVHRVVVAHRLGVVPVTESSVVIIVSSQHRASGLAAVAWAIDELKTTVPIWKREFYVDEASGEEQQREGPQCCEHRAVWKSNPEFVQRFRPDLLHAEKQRQHPTDKSASSTPNV